MTDRLPRIRLTQCGLDVSRLGLGTSRLHYLPDPAARAALIKGALDLTITHFDTARLYGDGHAEKALGEALRGQRERATIATKFGLLPSTAIELSGRIAMPFWAARSALRRFGVLKGPSRRFAPAAMEASLNRSLRALRTDYVDILFVHDPMPSEVTAELIAALSRVRQSGKVRHIGVAGEHGAAVVKTWPGVFDVVQLPEQSWTDDVVPDFTFGAISAAPQRYGAAGLSGQSAQSVLIRALGRRPNGAILAGTSRLEHLKELARAVSDLT